MNILLFPFSLVVMFGKMLGNLRHAAMIYSVTLLMFVGMIIWAIYWDTLQPNPALTVPSGPHVRHANYSRAPR